MRVLHVNDRVTGGGAERALHRLVEAQQAAGDDVAVVAGEVSHTGWRRGLDVWDPQARRLLGEHVARFRPDVVHFHNVLRELSPAVLGGTRGTPAVLTLHDLRVLGAGEHHLPHPRALADQLVLAPLARREMRRHLAAVLVVADALTADARRIGVERVTTARMPVPSPLVPPRPVEDCHDVVFAGRVAGYKGVDVLLAAFAEVAGAHPAARLVIAGDGPDLGRVRHATAAMGDRVVCTGHLDDRAMSAVLGSARLVAVPSLPALRREGAPLIAAEAARHARPVVTSDDPGAAELARAADNLVVPAGDIAALAGALDAWLGDPAAAAAAGRRAQQVANDWHDPANVVAVLRAAYAAARMTRCRP